MKETFSFIVESYLAIPRVPLGIWMGVAVIVLLVSMAWLQYFRMYKRLRYKNDLMNAIGSSILSVLQHSPIAAFWVKDTKGRYLIYNSSLATTLYPEFPESLIGLSDVEIISGKSVDYDLKEAEMTSNDPTSIKINLDRFDIDPSISVCYVTDAATLKFGQQLRFIEIVKDMLLDVWKNVVYLDGKPRAIIGVYVIKAKGEEEINKRRELIEKSCFCTRFRYYKNIYLINNYCVPFEDLITNLNKTCVE